MPDQDKIFTLRLPVNRCRDEIRTVASRCIKIVVLYVLRANQDIPSLYQLDDLLEPRMSASLTDMSRLDPKHCRLNKEFTVMLKRKNSQ